MPTVRLAAAQLSYHAAFEGGGRQLQREPTGSWEGRGLSALRAGTADGDRLLRTLRERIEQVYLDEFRPRLEGVVRFCRDLNVDLLVLPEYAAPYPLLPTVAKAAGARMTVVAGTHLVTVDAYRKSGVYERLGLSGDTKPVIGSATAPVLRNGVAIAMQTKLSASKWEPDLVLGDRWSAIPIGSWALGVLVCLDFLKREGDVGAKVAAELNRCAVLAVPSLTPFATIEHFERNAEELLFGYGTPVVYANHASEGGTRLITPEDAAPAVLASGRPPILPSGVEGVVVADVQIEEPRQRYAPVVASRTVAAAVFMEERHWRDLKEKAEAILASSSVDEAFSRLEGGATIFRQAAASAELPSIARDRWQYLADGAEGTQRLEHLHALSRDVWHDGIVSHARLERALTEASIRVLREVERGAQVPIEVAGVRRWLESEVLERLKSAGPPPERIINQIIHGLVPEALPLPRKTPASDGRIERWIEDPGEIPNGISTILVGALRVPLPAWSRAELEKVPIDSGTLRDGASFRATKLALPRLDRAAGLLSLLGAPPAWASSVDGHLLLILRDGRIVLYGNEASFPEELVSLTASRRDFPQALIEFGPPPSAAPLYTSAVVGTEIRRMARHQRHIHKISQFETSDEGKRFVEPDARLRGGKIAPIFTHFDSWLVGNQSLLLVLGEYGVGKSTTARALAARLAHAAIEGGARPIVLVDLREWSGDVDLAGLVRRAIGEEDVSKIRFAVEEGECILILDGFDEMTNQLSPSQLADALRALLSWRTDRSKIVLTCRTHLFVDPVELEKVFSEVVVAPLRTTLGNLTNLAVVELQLFNESHIRSYLRRVSAADGSWEALTRTHDLRNLAERPLLLDLIRQTLPKLVDDDNLAVSDIYEYYIDGWATWAGSQEWLTPEEKIAFAEALARVIWRGGDGVDGDAVHWSALVGLVSNKLSEDICRKIASHAGAQLELRSGSFLVWRDAEGGGYYRFAHRSFLEYLLARRIVRELASGVEITLDLPRVSPEVIAYCLARPAWAEARRAVEAILISGYRSRLSENALLLAHHDRTIASSKTRPWRLDGAQLESMRLPNAALAGAWLEGANLSGAQLNAANLSGARLMNANLQRADLRHATCEDAGMRSIDARGTQIDDCRFDRADLRDARFDGSSALERQPSFVDSMLSNVSVAATAWRKPILNSTQGLVGLSDARWRDDLRHAEQPASSGEVVTVEVGLHTDQVADIAFDPSGARLVTACHDGKVRIFDSSSGRLLMSLVGHAYWVTCLSLSADGTKIVSGSRDKTVRVWDAASGALLRCIEEQNMLFGVSISRDNSLVAAAVLKNVVRIWSTTTGRVVRELTGHEGPVVAVVFLPDGARVMTASWDKTVRLWDVQSGAQLQVLTGHTEIIRKLVVSADGLRAVTGSDDKTARVWDIIESREIKVLTGSLHQVISVGISPDGQRVAAGSTSTILWDVNSGIEVAQISRRGVYSIAFSPDGARIALGLVGSFSVFGARTCNLQLAVEAGSPHEGEVCASKDGRLIASASFGSPASVHLWSALDGRFLREIEAHPSLIGGIAASRDGRRVASGAHDGIVKVWDTESGALIVTLLEPGVTVNAGSSDETVDALAISDDGKIVVAGHRGGWIRIWELATNSLLKRLIGHKSAVADAAFSPDGRFLATASHDDTVRLWNVSSWTPGPAFVWHGSCVSAVAFSPDSSLLATASYDNFVGIWDIRNVRRGPLRVLRGHSDWVSGVVFTADGKRVVSSSFDATLRIWDVATGRQNNVLGAHSGPVVAMASLSNGNGVVTTSFDGTTRIWDIDKGLVRAQFWAVRNGGVTTAGSYAALSNPVDVELCAVRTSAGCAPLALYADLCVRPDLVAAIVSGETVPFLSIPMDVAERFLPQGS
ncbi:pentapeptide repeat-containing protein [Sorangium sp. So ce131]|uniref:WD40 domain-containing protein n=1 Tax=Sorangium sp. So ce131 TaxID=3133282 RepID=UPI003F61B377